MILKHAMALREIRASDAWIMTTDGEISNTQVNALTTLANSEHVMQIPIVLLIAGNRYTPSPETTNISVAIPFYAGATDAMLLYKDVSDGRIYVVSAKGAFRKFFPSIWLPSPVRVVWNCKTCRRRALPKRYLLQRNVYLSLTMLIRTI